MTMPDLTVILNGHREGILAHHTLRTLHRSVSHAHKAGLAIEVLAVLDNADDVTRTVIGEAAGPNGYLQEVADARVIEVSVADLGLARNHGVREASAPYIAVLDADNLPSLTWLLEAHRTASDHGEPCVVHPESLVIFEGRAVVWPQWSTRDPRFRAENFYDQNYWDACCLASREVFERHPYDATGRDSGFGPEDWHWNTEVVAAGTPHLVAKGTVLFYRAKTVGSLMSAHRAGGSLIHQTPFLTDPEIAAATLDEARSHGRDEAPRRSRLLKRLVRETSGKQARRRLLDAEVPPAPLTPTQERLARLRPGFVDPAHYRYLYNAPGLSDDEAVEHFRTVGREAGRRGWLSREELDWLRPDRFRVHHYRALHHDVVGLSAEQARIHYLTTGHAEGRRAVLRKGELKDLATLVLDDYRDRYPDLAQHNDNQLVQHYLEWGRDEKRITRFTVTERRWAEAVTVSDEVEAEWREMHGYEPWVPVPTASVLENYHYVGPPYDGSLTAGSAVWWQAIAALDGARPDVIFFAPWVRMGGGDLLLARYATAMTRARPDLTVAVITTHGRSTHPELLGDDVTLVDLHSMAGYSEMDLPERQRMAAMLVGQFRPRVVHIFNSPEAYDAVQHYKRSVSAHSRIFLSTFAIDYGADGEIYSQLARRPADYLDVVDRVIVDNHAIVDQFHTIFGMPRSRFAVHHQPVELPPRRAWTARQPDAPLQVLWAARFDRQKRLDVLADVAEAAAGRGLPVDWHVYGAPVIASAADNAEAIARLEQAGATFHGTYSSLDDLPLDDIDAFLLTSENEGIPLTLLDIVARRVPVVAPLVGGIGELVSENTGWPVGRFDDADAYIDVLERLRADREEADRRADAGYLLLADDFSWDAYHRRLQEIPGYLP
ncbi:glycosyltransferase [Nocardioides cavernae]|uniref:Glycosyltransferase n=1 Tax=Nocardioides cavernae TaxID=1921566 RepID=A0ABR8N6H5_9ACTN|nr:glycosyltransferase [Nocardioides cavernae]MBD3923750.1 glycosyltransferase [Nocardioides cavernae]MBM7511317.1 glycosyltransferase involved in cell wall biosynthesis [Nocardioides cavernae]